MFGVEIVQGGGAIGTHLFNIIGCKKSTLFYEYALDLCYLLDELYLPVFILDLDAE